VTQQRSRWQVGILWLAAALFFLPMLWLIMTAFKTDDDLLAVPPRFLFTPTLERINAMLAEPNTLPYFLNSVMFSLASAALALFVAFLAVYALSRYRPRLSQPILFVLLSTRMIPSAAMLLMLFQLFNLLKLRNAFGLLLMYTALNIPLSVWILKGFVDSVSLRFDETAIVNGASIGHVMFRVVLPQIRPGLIAAFIFNFVFVWNEWLFNLILGTPGTQMLPYALGLGLERQDATQYVSALALAYVLLPIVIVFVFQRYFLIGMTFGTVRDEM